MTWQELVRRVRALPAHERHAAVIALTLDMRGRLAGATHDDCNGGGLPDFHVGILAGINHAWQLREHADDDGTNPPAPPHDWESAKRAVDEIIAQMNWGD